MKRQGLLFVLSAPSGSGKTTLIQELLRRNPGLVRSISMTTRPPRPGEKQGRDYRFVSPEFFERTRKQRGFLEWARVFGRCYGTPRRPIEKALRQGRDVLLGVDVQGARQIRSLGVPAALVFVLPPSMKVLKQRLKRRGTESPEQVANRLQVAVRELAELPRYDYAVVNDRLKEAVKTVETILRAEKHRVRKR